MNVSRIDGLLTLRNYLLIICGAVQLFFAFQLFFRFDFLPNLTAYMWLPGIATFLSWLSLSGVYGFASRRNANMLFDELTIDRFRSLTSDGYAIVNIGVFILFSIQDWQNWNFTAANTLLIDLSAMMFLVWGGLIVVFVVKEWPEASYGEAS